MKFIVSIILSCCSFFLFSQQEVELFKTKYNFPANIIAKSFSLSDVWIERIDVSKGGCDFYGEVVETFLRTRKIDVELVNCNYGGFRNVKRLGEYVDNKMLDVSIDAYSTFKNRGNNYYLLHLSIYGKEECFSTVVLIRIIGGKAEIIYPDRFKVNVMMDMFNVLTWSTIQKYYKLDSILTTGPNGQKAFSIEKTNRDGYVSMDDVNQCRRSQGTDSIFLALSIVFNHDSILREGVLEPVEVKYSLEYFKHSSSSLKTAVYKTPFQLLGAFMQAYEADDAPILYHRPTHAPKLGYSAAKPRRSITYYDENCLKFDYQVTLPNSYDLELIAVVFDIVKDGSYQESAALLLLLEDNTFKIFTDFEAYPGLLAEIRFPLAFRAKSVYDMANTRLDKIHNPIEREAFMKSRRHGERTFLPEVFMSNIQQGNLSDEVINYMLKPIRIIGPNEFW